MVPSVLLVEDEPIMRALLDRVITGFGYHVEPAADARTACGLLETTEFHVIVLDLDLGHGPTGLDVWQFACRQHRRPAPIVLSRHRSPLLVSEETRHLPRSTIVISKSDVADVELVRQALVAAHTGRQFVQPAPPWVPTISRKQAALLRLLADGLSNDEIAERRGVTRRAVEMSLHRLYDALCIEGATSRSKRLAAVRCYVEGSVAVR